MKRGLTNILTPLSNQANGTVNVFNGCEANGQAITIQGTATIVPEVLGYGEEGVFRVQFPGQPEPECPGPNYIVQGELSQEHTHSPLSFPLPLAFRRRFPIPHHPTNSPQFNPTQTNPS